MRDWHYICGIWIKDEVAMNVVFSGRGKNVKKIQGFIFIVRPKDLKTLSVSILKFFFLESRAQFASYISHGDPG